MKEHLDNLFEKSFNLIEDTVADDMPYIENLFLSFYIEDFKIETEEDLLFSLIFS